MGMDRIEALYTFGFVLLLASLLAQVLVRRIWKKVVLWMDLHGWINYEGDRDVPTYGTVGNAFLAMQSAMEPHKKYVLEAKQEEREERDDEGGPDRAGRRPRRRRRRAKARRRRRIRD